MNLRVADERATLSSPTSDSSLFYRPSKAHHDVVICYVCQTPTIRGKFNGAKATALGVKGRDRGVLVRGGGPITLQDGTVVTRSDVVGEDTPGSGFAILRCPTVEHLEILSSSIIKQGNVSSRQEDSLAMRP